MSYLASNVHLFVFAPRPFRTKPGAYSRQMYSFTGYISNGYCFHSASAYFPTYISLHNDSTPIISLVVVYVLMHACSAAKSSLTLCDTKDCSPPGSSVHWISQARILEWVAISSVRVSSRLRDQTCMPPVSPTLAGGFFYHWGTWETVFTL